MTTKTDLRKAIAKSARDIVRYDCQEEDANDIVKAAKELGDAALLESIEGALEGYWPANLTFDEAWIAIAKQAEQE